MRVLLINYDNADFTGWFPQGLAYVASALQKVGHEVVVTDYNVFHEPYGDELVDLDDVFDAVGISACGGYWQFRQVHLLLEKLRQNCRTKIIVGGHLFAPDPGYWLQRGVDQVFVGEAERAIAEGQFAFGPAVVTDGRYEDLEEIDWPAYELFELNHYSLMRMPNIGRLERCLPVVAGRGCTHRCTFCYRMEKGIRYRESESVVEEIKLLQEEDNIGYIAFSDELFMSTEKRTLEMCAALEPLGIKWDCNGRLDVAARAPHVLDAMKEAGCVFINYGIEAYDDEVLRLMNKRLTCEQVDAGVCYTKERGISPGLNFMWGNPGDTQETLWKAVTFLENYDDFAQLRTIRPVTPYPGTDLYKQAVLEGKLRGYEDFYEKHTNSDLFSVHFMDMGVDKANEMLYYANRVLLNRFYNGLKRDAIEQARKLYIEKDSSFRGFRQK